jgi:hypothetical protein
MLHPTGSRSLGGFQAAVEIMREIPVVVAGWKFGALKIWRVETLDRRTTLHSILQTTRCN